MSYITAIGTANPAHKFSQMTLADFMTRAMNLNNHDTRKLKTIFKASGIESRYSVLEDYGKSQNYSFYSNSPDFEPLPSTKKRLEQFEHHALQLSLAAIRQMSNDHVNILDGITHIIVVCCTGMYAPGLDIELVKELRLPSSVKRTCITFMGCYAAFNAIKVADAFCKADPCSKVLLVCTELCSLHFQKEASEDNFLANALFADGSAAIMMENTPSSKVSLSLESFHCDLSTVGQKDMAWRIGDFGFEMRLSSYVPDVIRSGIKKLTQNLLDTMEKNIEEVKYFAIHPGGRKILETIETQLIISREKTFASYEVLKNFGNMSSPTVLFVLYEIWKRLTEEDHNALILGMAFGPGLTLESMLLKAKIN
jgi:prepilin-type processing-associated H-X9-DG protein